MGSGRIFLSHATASVFWTHHDLFETEETRAALRSDDVPDNYMVSDARRWITGLSEDDDVHILISSPRQKRSVDHCKQHWRKDASYPVRSFRKVSTDVMVASPELCFLQAATVMPLLPLMLYGFELCGSYARTSDTVRYKREPLTCVSRLGSYLERSRKATGFAAAKRALRYVLDGSASPRESALVLMMTLPPRLGGYGMPAPQLNYGIQVNLPDKFNPGQMLTLHGDIVWLEAGLIVEYDGRQHDELMNSASDKQRDHVLLDAGYEVVRITDRQIRSSVEMQRLARTINTKGTYRRPGSRFDPDTRYFEAQNELLFRTDPPWIHKE